MKKKDFDFNQVGKKMPYKVNDNFFEDVTSKILEQLEKEEKNKLRYVRPHRRHILYWSSSVAALIALVFLWQGIYHADSQTLLYRKIEQKKMFPNHKTYFRY